MPLIGGLQRTVVPNKSVGMKESLETSLEETVIKLNISIENNTICEILNQI